MKFALFIVLVGLSAVLCEELDNTPKAIADSLNLNQALSSLQQVGAGVYAQVAQALFQLLAHGQNLYQLALPVIQQLVSDLTNHVGNAGTIVQAALGQLTNLVQNSGKRDLVDFYNNLQNLVVEIQTIIGQALWNFITNGQISKRYTIEQVNDYVKERIIELLFQVTKPLRQLLGLPFKRDLVSAIHNGIQNLGIDVQQQIVNALWNFINLYGNSGKKNAESKSVQQINDFFTEQIVHFLANLLRPLGWPFKRDLVSAIHNGIQNLGIDVQQQIVNALWNFINLYGNSGKRSIQTRYSDLNDSIKESLVYLMYNLVKPLANFMGFPFFNL